MIKDKDEMSRDLYGDLRDYFAGQVANALIIDLGYDFGHARLAEKSYDMAEAMMKERSERYGITDRPEQKEKLQ
jgi:hypothetical protein